ncbi:MAG: hypothetical protein KC417_03890, partial [Myxococcales bacterium]|nr:hypothetical protein [Myxococcales bacterium]
MSASAVAMLVSAALHGGAWAASGFALDRAGDQASPTSNVAVDFVLDVAEPSPEPVPAPEPVKTVSVARVRPVVPPTAVPSRDENVKEAAVP